MYILLFSFNFLNIIAICKSVMHLSSPKKGAYKKHYNSMILSGKFFRFFGYFIQKNFPLFSYRIRCASWLNAGSRIIENKLGRVIFLFLAPAGGYYSAGPYPNTFPNQARQSYLYLT